MVVFGASARPYHPVTGFVVGTGESKLGGAIEVDDYAFCSVRDGDVVTAVYDADRGTLTFSLNGTSLGEAYGGINGPVVAALAVNSARAIKYELCKNGDTSGVGLWILIDACGYVER